MVSRLTWTKPYYLALLLGIFLGFAAAASSLVPSRSADAACTPGSQQKNSYNAYSGYCMHEWLTHWWNVCDIGGSYIRSYSYGQDSRYSWGGPGRNLDYLAMIPRRAWVCATLMYNESAYVYNTYYHYDDSPTWGYGSCGPQADLHGRFYRYGYVDWWTYLNY